ncbi:MAG: hypothetical protein WCD20_08260 [Rhodomicrobium sp.]
MGAMRDEKLEARVEALERELFKLRKYLSRIEDYIAATQASHAQRSPDKSHFWEPLAFRDLTKDG